jgi:N-methylhydantoinase B
VSISETYRAEDYVLGPSRANWDELGRELAVDPVLFEIVRHKLEAINEEQAIALKEVSVSPIVTDASDFNNALYTADGRIASMGPQVVFHSGSMPIVLRYVMELFEGDINDGDMFVVNDPYYGAVHHPDISLVAPIFHEGRLVAWSGVAAHQVDMGGMSVGSISVRAREKQQEGLMMPPMKLMEGGTLRQDLWRMILNASRQPQIIGLDLRGFIASNSVARDRLRELMTGYGSDTVLTVMEELIRYSERRMRERLRELPDGVYHHRGWIDHDGIENKVYRIDARLVKNGDTLTCDLSDSAGQSPSYLNSGEGALVGAVFGGVAPFLAGGIPWNQGILNAVEVIAPEGTIVNAKKPAATGAATIAVGWTVMTVVGQAISKLLSFSDELRDHSFAATHGTFAALFTGDRNQHGEGYGNQLIDAQIGGGGASAVTDGIDQAGGLPAPKPHIANIESNELHGPFLFLYRSFFPDTGGDGAFRGGRAAGTAWTPHGVDRTRNAITAHGVEVPVSYGQFGGWPGACNRQAVIHGTNIHALLADGRNGLVLEDITQPLDLEELGGEIEHLAAKVDEFALTPGDVVQYTWQGGGGYGDPLSREIEAVEEDVALALISEERAAGAYGLVPGDPDATEQRRDELRRQRLEVSSGPERSSPLARGERVTRIGHELVLAWGATGRQFECACGHVFCDATENWKEFAASHRLHGGDVPKQIVVHADLELVEYLCPSCGRRHALDVAERGLPPVQDFRLA